MSTITAALRPVPIPKPSVLRSDPAAQAFMLLRIAFTVAPILFGLDKFAEVMINDWPQVSGHRVQRHHPGQRPGRHVHRRRRRDRRRPRRRRSSRASAACSWPAGSAGIIVSLLLVGGYADIALRDFGLLIGALALARLATAYAPEGWMTAAVSVLAMEDARPLGAVTAFDDADSEAWLAALRATGSERDDAVARLHELLLKAARFEVGRRRAALPHLRGDDFDDLAVQSADDALVAILKKLDTFRGDSRFTTWAYKFALLEAAVKLRRRAWQGRESAARARDVGDLPHRGHLARAARAEQSELLREIQAGIQTALTPHQREVLVALALNEVPIDVVAERLDTTRGALYKTLHDARKKLRAHIAEKGIAP